MSVGDKVWDVVIVGAGAAGLAAAIYSSRARRQTLVLEKKVVGGQIMDTEMLENYPGYAQPVSPLDLMGEFSKQAERYGAVIENEEATALQKESGLWQVQTSGGGRTGRALIYAAGAMHRLLGVPGEKELLGRGISVCATCDAPFFMNHSVAIVGGGDAAVTEALYLAKFASEVFLIHRRDSLRAEKILQERFFSETKIKPLWHSEVVGFRGQHKLEVTMIKDKQTGKVSEYNFPGVFLAIGFTPNTDLIRELADLDEAGYAVSGITLKTRTPGLFVAGELVQGNGRQLAISSGMGVQAAISCEHYLAQLDGR